MDGIFIMVLVITLGLGLVIFFIVRNNMDRREFERHLKSNYRKAKDVEKDVEEDLKQD